MTHPSTPPSRPATLRQAQITWRRAHRRTVAVAVLLAAAAVLIAVGAAASDPSAEASGGLLRMLVTSGLTAAALTWPVVVALAHVATAGRSWPGHVARLPRLLADVFRAAPGRPARVVLGLLAGFVTAVFVHPLLAVGVAVSVLGLAPTEVGQAVAETRVAGHVARARTSGRPVRTDAARWTLSATSVAGGLLAVGLLRLLVTSTGCALDTLLGSGCASGGAHVAVAVAAAIGAVAVTPLALATGVVLARVMSGELPDEPHPVPSHVDVVDEGATEEPSDDATDDPTDDVAPVHEVASSDPVATLAPAVAEPLDEEPATPEAGEASPVVAEPIEPEVAPAPPADPVPVGEETTSTDTAEALEVDRDEQGEDDPTVEIPPVLTEEPVTAAEVLSEEPDLTLAPAAPTPVEPTDTTDTTDGEDGEEASEATEGGPDATDEDADLPPLFGTRSAVPPADAEPTDDEPTDEPTGAPAEDVVPADAPPAVEPSVADGRADEDDGDVDATHPVDRAFAVVRPQLASLSDPTRDALVALFASVARAPVEPDADALEQLSTSLRDVPIERTRRAVSLVRANTGKVAGLRSQYQRSPRIAKGAIEKAAITGLRAAGVPGDHADTVARTLLTVDAEDWQHLTGALDTLDVELADGPSGGQPGAS